jgi:hypothetical protein
MWTVAKSDKPPLEELFHPTSIVNSGIASGN